MSTTEGTTMNACDGHPAGAFDPMGVTTYCDGSCKPKSKPPRYTTRAPLSVRIERQEKKLKDLDEKLGRMMTRRADEEEKLADLYRILVRLEG